MSRRFRWFRLWLTHRAVRPWALLTPVLVLVVALPLLRPLRAPGQLSDGELLLLQTTRSLRVDGDLALDPVVAIVAPDEVIHARGRVYAAQPPGFALLLTVPDRLLHRLGIDAIDDPDLHQYLLTFLGVTLPVALAAGLVYRLGRLFELTRPVRAAVAVVVVFGSGWISYATVLNPHAVSAALLVSAVALLARAAASSQGGLPLILAPLVGAALGGAIIVDPVAMVVAVGVVAAALTVRFRPWTRLLFPALLFLGALPPLVLHAAWVAPITGDVLPGIFHAELASASSDTASTPLDEFEPAPLGTVAQRWLDLTVGRHGLLSHFPVLVLSIIGVAAVMHRHWPIYVKVLAVGSLFAVAAALAGLLVSGIDLRRTMFANRFALATLPLLAVWVGAWVRRRHHLLGWSVAAGVSVVSVLVSLLGATAPMPPGGYERFTAWESAQRLLRVDLAHRHRELVEVR